MLDYRFDCKLDTIVLDQSVQRQCVYGDTSKACSFSPCNFTYGYEGNTSYQNLKDGFYEFSVRAVDIVRSCSHTLYTSAVVYCTVVACTHKRFEKGEFSCG